MDTAATEPRLASDHHDAILALALGSLSVAQRFEGLLGRVTIAAVPPPDLDDPVVLAALGLVSLGRTLRRWLEAAAAPAQPPATDTPSGDAPAPRELLR